MSTTRVIRAGRSTGTGIQKMENVTVQVPDQGTGNGLASVGFLKETVAVASFTDGGSTAGTYQMVGAVPAGAIILGSKIGPVTGFAGDTTATLKIGDGSDDDRYMTGTPSVFTTQAVGVDCGVPSGTKLVTTANRPTLTVTSSSDFTAVKSNGAGVVTVTIYFLQTA